MSIRTYTHEEWHEANGLRFEDCADCGKHGRICSHEEIWEAMTPEQREIAIRCSTAPDDRHERREP